MIIFLLVCIPASYFIDRFGIRMGLEIGAVLTEIFGLMKGFYPSDYTLVVIAQTGLAVAQPFIINAATKVAVQWFPLLERGLAVGISTLAQFIGIIIVLICTPLIIQTDMVGVYDLSSMLMTYGLISGTGAVIMLVFLRKKPRPLLKSPNIKRIQASSKMLNLFSATPGMILLLIPSSIRASRNSYPVISGIVRSKNIKSKVFFRQRFNASLPFPASVKEHFFFQQLIQSFFDHLSYEL